MKDTGYILSNSESFVHFTLWDCQKTLYLNLSCSNFLTMVRTKNPTVPAGEKMIDDRIDKEPSNSVFEERRDYISQELSTGKIDKENDVAYTKLGTPRSRPKRKFHMDAIAEGSSPPMQRTLLD